MKANFEGAVVRILFLFLIGLAAESVAQADTDSARSIHLRGFSILPPSGNDWAVRQSSPNGIHLFDVARSKRDHTLFVWVELMGLDGLMTDSAQHFARDVHARMKTPEDRFRVLEAEAIPYRAHATDCVRFRRLGEEWGNRLFPGIVFVEERAGFICRHPHDPRMGVMAAYSERRLSGAMSLLTQSLKQEMEEILSTILFTPIQ